MSHNLKTSFNNIYHEFKNHKKFSDNYDVLLNLPIVKKLKEKNRKLRILNKKLFTSNTTKLLILIQPQSHPLLIKDKSIKRHLYRYVNIRTRNQIWIRRI